MSRRNYQQNQPMGLPNFTPRPDRKTLQLCAQIRDALHWVLGSTDEDEEDNVLMDCQVIAVEPLPGGNRVLVKIGVPPEISLTDVQEELGKSANRLRMEVAQAITRRKVPELIYLPTSNGSF